MQLRITRSNCPRRGDRNKRVELFWSTLDESKKQPLIILVHGHNVGLRSGGRTELFTGMLELFAENRMVAVAMSQPGYGRTDGPADFCGPATHDALMSVIDHFAAMDFVDETRIAVYGQSRGATVAMLTAAKDPRISAVISRAGLYNLLDGYSELSEGIRASLSRETTGSVEDLRERSPLYHLEKIQASILLIHGARDEIASSEWAKSTYGAGLRAGRKIRLELFQEYGHGIPFELCAKRSAAFLAEAQLIQPPLAPFGLPEELAR